MADAPVLDQVLETLRAAQPRAREIGVEFVGVVGSFASGEAKADSDVDIVYDVHGQGYLWALAGLAAELEDALGRRVDLVDRAMMQPERWAWMARNLAPL